MLLPGPEAIQLAIYVGWLLHRVPGGLAAGICFLLPSVFILMGLSYVYAAYGSVTWIAALFYGLKPAVLAIVASATLRIGAKALRHPLMYGLAAAAFIALFFFKVPFPLVIAGSAAAGFLGVHFLPQVFAGRVGAADEQAYVISDNSVRAEHTRPSFKRAARVSGVCLLLWVIPLLLLGWWQAWHHVFFQEALFFSKAAMITFGVFVTPAIYRLSGCGQPPQRFALKAKLTRNIPSAAGREDYVPVKIEEKDGELHADPVFGKSNLLFAMIRADGLARVPLDKAGMMAGDLVEITLF